MSVRSAERASNLSEGLAALARASLDAVLRQRARRLVDRLATYLPREGTLLDVGSGTGHNAAQIERRFGLQVVPTDVVDMSAEGVRPVLFDGAALPFPERHFAAVLILFVLHYSEDPVKLLREARRVSAGPVIVLQSTYSNPSGKAFVGVDEFIWGRIGFSVARRVGLVPATCEDSLRPVRMLGRADLHRLFALAGATPRSGIPAEPACGVERDLYVLD